MKRTILALAAASLSCAALAGPPGPPMTSTVDVNVVNPTLSVNVAGQPIAVLATPSITPKTDFFVWGTSDYGNPVGANHQLDFPVLLTGVAVQLQMSQSGAPLDRCNLSVTHNWIDGTTKMSRRLANVIVLNNTGTSVTYVPLPNIYADTADLLEVFAAGVGSGSCVVNAWIYGVKTD